MELLMADVKDKDRVLRHFRWRSTEFLVSRGSARFARLFWTVILLGLSLIALWAEIQEPGLVLSGGLWLFALGGFGIWLLNLFQGRPALGWTGYYVAWVAFSGIIMNVPHLLNMGRSAMAIGAILAVLDLPSSLGFLTMAAWGVLVGVLIETNCLQAVPDLRAVGLLPLVYVMIPFALHCNLGVLERLFANGFSDDLTNVGNRKLLRWLQTSLWPPVQRQGRSLSLLLLDLDDFKTVNDNLGHVAGDRMLRRLAQVIEGEIRHDDVVCRYGGDEFVIILLDSATAEAVAVADRLRRRVAEVSRQEFADYPVTASIGVANYPKHARTMAGLLEEADRALMGEAKLRGRNRVATASSLDRPESWVAVGWRLPRKARALVEIICLSTGETLEHMSRLADLGYGLGEALGLPEIIRTDIVQAAALHDVGKIAVPRGILEDPGPLTWEERQMVMLHSELGATMLANLDVEESVVDAVRHHHEWWNGTGYPDGLLEDEIPIQAAVLAVADAYDAMTNDRPYRKTRTPEEAMQEILDGSGVQFNPSVVAKMQELFDVHRSA